MGAARSDLPADPPLDARTLRILPWLVAVALFMENLDATIINTAVPTMARSLSTDVLSLRGVLTSYALSLAVFIPVSGWMADKFGTRRVFALAIVIFLLGSIACGLAPNTPTLVVARLVQGIGGAMMTPVGRIVMVRSYPRSELLRVMSFVIIPALIGPLIGPSLGGLIVSLSHWRVIFFINIPIAILGLVLVRRHLPNYLDAEVAKLDWRGFLLFGSGIALVCYALEVFSEHTLPGSAVGLILAVGLALLAFYLLHSRRVAAPVLALWLLKVRTFRISVVGGFVTRLGMAGMPFLLPLLYQLGLGFPAWKAGMMTIPQAAAAMLNKAYNRHLLARFGHRQILIVNTILIGLTIMTFSLVGPATPLGLILLLGFAQGTFASMQFTSMNTLAYADIDNRDASKASSLASTAQQLSISFGVAFGSLVTGLFLGFGAHQAGPEMLRALHHAFLTIGGFTILAALLFWQLRGADGESVSRHAHPGTGQEHGTGSQHFSQ